MVVPYEEKRAALDPEVLLGEARRLSGLDDMGDERFLYALRMMTRYYAEDLEVSSEGLGLTRSTIVRQLVNRARFEADLRWHPEILDEDVSDPMVIIGLPRSGTTKSHRMMGVDPNLLKTYMWQLTNPAPFPDARPGERDPRIAAANADEPLIHASDTNAALRAGHLYASEEVQSDIWLYGFTFNDNFYSTQRPPSPAYYHYTQDRTYPSHLDNIEYVANLYRYLQWQQGGRRGRRWLMKHEGMIGVMDEFLAVHPGATFIHLHRDPHTTIASILKLGIELGRPYLPDMNSGDQLFNVLERLSRLLHRYLRLRDDLALDDRIVDVPYEQIRNDPMPAFRTLYDRAGHPLTPESADLMLAYERANEQGKHGKHTYSLEMFGLTDRLIDQLFAEYIRRFIDV
jgi:hypothetical protein